MITIRKPVITKEARYALDYIFAKISGHSNYHGDDILCAIEHVKEGKDIKHIRTLDELEDNE